MDRAENTWKVLIDALFTVGFRSGPQLSLENGPFGRPELRTGHGFFTDPVVEILGHLGNIAPALSHLGIWRGGRGLQVDLLQTFCEGLFPLVFP